MILRVSRIGLRVAGVCFRFGFGVGATNAEVEDLRGCSGSCIGDGRRKLAPSLEH